MTGRAQFQCLLEEADGVPTDFVFGVNPDDMQQWQICIKTDVGSVFCGEWVRAAVTLAVSNHDPPLVTFPKNTASFHPNIGMDGRPCLSLLSVSGWTPCSMMALARMLQLFLHEPDFERGFPCRRFSKTPFKSDTTDVPDHWIRVPPK